jgi:hypothetical protein
MGEIRLLDIEQFIQKNGYGEVQNSRLPSEKAGYDPLSLWSELIFGRYGSKERKTRFGWINLKVPLINPEVYNLIKTVSEETSRIINRKKTYIVKDKKFIEDINGETGLVFLINNFNNVDFTLFFKKEKNDEAQFIEKNKKIIIINKWIVCPAAIRDIDYRNKDSFKVVSPINELYKDMFFIINQFSGDSIIDEVFIERLQMKLFQIADWFKKNKLAGKGGMFRGTMLKKSMDFTTRLILISSPDLGMGQIGIPWHTAMAIFEPIFSYHLFKKNQDILLDIQQYLGVNNFGQDDFDNFVRNVINNPEAIPPSLVTKLRTIAEEVCKNQVVICKRDPVTDRNSYFSAVPVIIPGRVAVVNSLQLKPIGGDSDGDTISIVPLFSEEAKREARQSMMAGVAPNKFNSLSNYGKTIYSLWLDSASTLFKITRDPNE